MSGFWRLGLALAILGAASAQAEVAHPDLDRAVQLIGDLQYADAAKALEAAWTRPGNDRATVLRILELQGIVAATLNQASSAKEYFQTLLLLDPERRLPGDYPPRVTGPFYEAKGLATEQPRLELKPSSPVVADGKVKQLAVEVVSDAGKMGRKVRFHIRGDAHPWRESVADLYANSGAAATDAERVEWWAVLLGEHDMELVSVGSPGAPLRASVDGAVAAGPKKPGADWLGRGPTARYRPIAYGCLGGGAAALAVGAIFGVQSSAARQEVSAALASSAGLVTGMTQKRAFELDAQARSSAAAANGLFTAGVVLAAAGGALWYAGMPVAVAPAPSGISVAGAF